MPLGIGKLNLEIKVGKRYKIEELKELGYELNGEIPLGRRLGCGKRFDKKNEIILAIQTNGLLKVIQYYNLENGLNIRFIGD